MCKANQSRGVLNVASAIALWLVVTIYAFLYPLSTNDSSPSKINALTFSLIFFNNLNIFIALCEICLGLNIDYIQRDYQKLRAKYNSKGGNKNEWDAVMEYLTMPLTLKQVFFDKTWLCKMWSTYALYDPSYQNPESFGFFIDFGNGLSTIPPSLLVNIAIVAPAKVSPLWVGCIGLACYWQVMYGAIVYVGTYMFNRRYEGKGLLEVCLFVGVSNCLWIVFPSMGIYACFCMLRDGSMEVFQ